MPGANYIVFENMRPPVAIDNQGKSPLRTKKGVEIFKLGELYVQDGQGHTLTKAKIVRQQTDDGRLADQDWNKRHHVSPSHFNHKNKSYHQVSGLLKRLSFLNSNSSISHSERRH